MTARKSTAAAPDRHQAQAREANPPALPATRLPGGALPDSDAAVSPSIGQDFGAGMTAKNFDAVMRQDQPRIDPLHMRRDLLDKVRGLAAACLDKLLAASVRPRVCLTEAI